MLSVSPISSAGGAAGYYAKDDYYVGDPEQGESALAWGGKGAELLGLQGPASQDQLRAMLEGDLAALAASEAPVLEGQSATDSRGDTEPAIDADRTLHEGPEGSGVDAPGDDANSPNVVGGPAPETKAAKTAASRTAPDSDRGHRPGDDLTFSAPKSVSLAILVGGDKQLLAAFDASVDHALAYAQEHFAMTRVRDGHRPIQFIRTQNLTYQKTTHSTSRHGDPQIHQHVLLANMTYESGRGAWLALFNRPIYEHQRLLGAIQRQDLARRAMALGYDLTWTREGTFELADVPQAAIDAFSKSAQRVEKNLEEAGPVSGGAKEIAKLKDRPTKLHTEMDRLHERWDAEARDVGVDVKALAASRDPALPGRDATPGSEGAIGRTPGWFSRALDILAERLTRSPDPYAFRRGEQPAEHERAERGVISRAIQVNAAQRAVFQAYTVLRDALHVGRGAHAVGDLQRHIDQLLREGRLQRARFDVTIDKVTAPTRASYVQGLTTQAGLAVESRILDVMKSGQGKARPLFDREAAEARLAGPHVNGAGKAVSLNPGQIAAAAHVLSSPDRVIAIHGSAGVGKTTLLGATVELAKGGREGALTMLGIALGAIAAKGMEAYGLAKSHAAKNELIGATGMKADSTAKFMLRHQNILRGEAPSERQRRGWDRRILFVDEASLLGNADVHSILTIGQALGVAKTVFVGDVRQLNAPEAGAPFRYLLNQGMAHAKVDTVVRQADQDLRAAVGSFTQGQGGRALAGLSLRGDILAASDRARTVPVTNLAFEAWRESFEREGTDRPVITVNQDERSAVNTAIAAHLVSAKAIKPVGDRFERLVPKHLQGSEQWRIESYALGDKLLFHAHHRRAEIERSERVTVVGKDASGRQKLLYVERADGSRTRINLSDLARRGSESFTAYTPRGDNQLYQNGRHTWEASDTQRNLLTGETFTIVGVERGLYRVRLRDGSEILMSPRDPQFNHSALAYAQTVYRWQGGTAERPIGLLEAANASHANAYVVVSRAVQGITIVTDDVERLRDRVRLNCGVNIVASENTYDAAGPGGPAPAPRDQGLRERLGAGVTAFLEIAALARTGSLQVERVSLDAEQAPNGWKAGVEAALPARETDPSLVRAPMDKNMIADRQPAIPERSR